MGSEIVTGVAPRTRFACPVLLTVTDFAALVVPTFCVPKDKLDALRLAVGGTVSVNVTAFDTAVASVVSALGTAVT